uniref:Uncharacterized protein n=1 Tax=Lepeophtheirus salmonis TaxID=72036 RepID=A0A0K2THS0_LEPSM
MSDFQRRLDILEDEGDVKNMSIEQLMHCCHE